MKTRELDGRRERNNGDGQKKSHRGLRSGVESVCFLPWVARLVGLPSGRVAADVGSERTDIQN